MQLGKEQSTGIATDQDDLVMTAALATGREAGGELEHVEAPVRAPVRAAVEAGEPAAAASR